jgi:hypothetical protein
MHTAPCSTCSTFVEFDFPPCCQSCLVSNVLVTILPAGGRGSRAPVGLLVWATVGWLLSDRDPGLGSTWANWPPHSGVAFTSKTVFLFLFQQVLGLMDNERLNGPSTFDRDLVGLVGCMPREACVARGTHSIYFNTSAKI